MKILLDTHLLLWWLNDDPALSPDARDQISDPKNVVFASAINHWEIWLKVSLGKLVIPSDFVERLSAEGFEALPFTASHARRVAGLEWHHRDPFDRALIAQALVEGFTLITADAALLAYGPHVKLV